MSVRNFQFLTPSVARIAYEQIVAWHIFRRNSSVIDDVIVAKPWEFLDSTLKGAGVDPELLQKAGFCTINHETIDNCGSTNYSRDEYTYTVDMRKLYEFAQTPLHALASQAQADQNSSARTLRMPKLPFKKP